MRWLSTKIKTIFKAATKSCIVGNGVLWERVKRTFKAFRTTIPIIPQ